MKISFLGTGAAEGFPAAFCACPHCEAARKYGEIQYRTRSQIVVDGDLSIDYPPEAYAHSLRFGTDLSALKYLLVTHSHMDHFYAHDFILRGYKYALPAKHKLHIYGNEEVAAVFKECTRREMRQEVADDIDLHVVKPFSVFTTGEYRVIALPAMHGTAEEALLYYVEKGGKGYLHLYDTGALSDEAVKYLADNGAHANAIAFDCTFLGAPPKAGARHMCAEDAVAILNRLKAAGIADGNTASVLTHFSHNANPTRDRTEAVARRYSMTAAYDGFILEV